MKAQLKDKRDIIRTAITAARRQLRQAEKEKRNAEANRLEKEIDRLAFLIKFYAASASPVQFSNGFIMDTRVFKQFIKKLPSGFLQSVSFSEDAQALELNHRNGKLTLYDLSKYYQDLKLPKGEVFLDDLGITLS